MKIALEVGDKVRVITGKLAGKEDVVSFIDKKTKRVRLQNLKKIKVKTKKGAKELHGTFHLASLVALKPAAEAADKPAEAAGA